jgi:DNA-binding transcriptional regulator YiaG
MDGKLILYTKISHGSGKDLDNHLIRQMSSQCKLTKEQFANLVNCPMSKDEYLSIIKDNGALA